MRGGSGSPRPMMRDVESFPKCEAQALLSGSESAFLEQGYGHRASTLPWVLTETLDILADPDCGGATDPDMVLSNNFRERTPWPQGAIQATEVGWHDFSRNMYTSWA